MNCINLNNFLKKFQTKYLLKILFLIGFLILVTKFENYLYSNDANHNCKSNTYNEWVIGELADSEEELPITEKRNYTKEISDDIQVSEFVVLYKFALFAHNHSISIKFKVSNVHIPYNANEIAVQQKNNIWHKSDKEESYNFC